MRRAKNLRARLGRIYLTLLLLIVGSPQPLFADSIRLPGWDLFETVSATSGGITFQGLPLHVFDFGGSIGEKNTGTADTIVRRKDAAVDPSAIIDIEVVALQLVSVAPIDVAGHFLYITLQDGQPSTGEMTITFGAEGEPHGTFDSFFDVFFDVRFGALDGPIVDTGSHRLSASDVEWSHFPPPLARQIDGVNTHLDGLTRSKDFWPSDTIRHVQPNPLQPAAIHEVKTAVPQPSVLLLLGVWSGVAAGLRVRRRR